MKKLFSIFSIFVLMWIFSPFAVHGQIPNYHFGTPSIDDSNPCCIWINAGSSTRYDKSWHVEVEGIIYNYTDYEPGRASEIPHCFQENGTYTVSFYVEGVIEPSWTKSVTIDDCKESCCEPPKASDLTITSISDNKVEICLKDRESCPGFLARFTYIVPETGKEVYFFNNPSESNCREIYLAPCTTYEFRGAYGTFNDNECGRAEYSESVEFTLPGGDCEEDCCKAPEVSDLIVTSISDNKVEVCLKDRAFCPELIQYFRYRVHGDSEWMYYEGINNCREIAVDPSTTYEFQGAYKSTECGITEYSDSVEFTTSDCCSLPTPNNITATVLDCGTVEVCIDKYGEGCNPAYTFAFRSSNKNWRFNENGFLLNSSCHELNHLDPCETYDFLVIASLNCGNIIQEIYDIKFDKNCTVNCPNSNEVNSIYRYSSDNNLAPTIQNSLYKELTISAYPNPTIDHLSIDINTNITENVDIQISDQIGRIIKELEVQVDKGINHLEINTSNFARGIYLLNISSNSINHSQKIMVVK